MMRADDRYVVAVMVAVALASLTLVPLTRDSSFLGPGWLIILLVGGLSAGLRRARLGPLLVAGVQTVVAAGVVRVVAPSTPTPDWSGWSRLVDSAADHIHTQSAPMAPHDAVRLLFIAGIGLAMVLTDLIVVGLRRPAFGLGPPAALFLVPALGLDTDTGVASFGCLIVGYLAILVADGLTLTARWSTGLSRDSADGFGTATPVVWRAAAAIGLPAVAAAVVAAVLLPTLSVPGGLGGTGRGGGLSLSDPTLDLRRNLAQPRDRTVITYRTDRPGGVYLRMASLERFDGDGWRSEGLDLTEGAQLPPIPGVSRDPGPRRRTTITIDSFDSEYLPLPYAPRRIEAPGSWTFDPTSLVVVAGPGPGRRQATRNLTYTVDSIDIAPDPADLAGSLPGTPADAAVTAAVPADLPASIRDLARDITADADTAAGQAAAIQTYLRSSRFTYSTEPLPGNGYQALENFLFEDRRGYCEQFAASMAAMVRVLGIPSRIGIGFLPGEQQGDTWRVGIRKMHAWPELFFAGYGWVRFEPTPAGITGTAPDWTVPAAAPERPGSDTPSQAAPQPSISSRPDTPADQPAPTAQTPTGIPGWRVLTYTALGLLAGAVLAAPATIRVRRRHRRLSRDGPTDDQVEAAWAEIRDTVIDTGGRWPAGSPRRIGGDIASRLDAPEAATMTRIATLVEQSRYARHIAHEDTANQLPELTRQVRTGLAGELSGPRRLLSRVAPRSLLPPTSRRPKKGPHQTHPGD